MDFPATATLSDNSGTLAKGNGFYWKRIINDTEQVNICHFGAKGGGITDDSDAFKRMLAWPQSYGTSAKDIGV
ncbi:exopolysaccharide biosynthesis protein CpsF [Erwinia tracheiphila PSU-1]|nr:exopolysaccharide biosynthesis protein CpsF [Erwinia tracheiphila PSU-1]